jgi:ribosomal protein S18 acetylase RimI-like enzyme
VSVRSAVLEDLNTILDLCRERPYPDLPIRGQTSEQRRQAILGSIEQNWRLLGREPRLNLLVNDNSDGFLVLFNGLNESISGDPQSVIQDLHGRTPEDLTRLLDEAERRTVASGGDYAVIELVPGETVLEQALTERGYEVEMLRILRSVHEVPTRTPRFHVRSARRTDQLFMMWLSEFTAFNTVVPGRSADPEEVALRFFASYTSQSFYDDPRMKAFIAEDLSDPENPTQIGYIILKLGFQDLVDQQRLAYIYDISVHPDYWGKRVFHDLMDQADRFMVKNRVTLLQGDISMNNQRALRAAVKMLGFQVEWQRWAKKLV